MTELIIAYANRQSEDQPLYLFVDFPIIQGMIVKGSTWVIVDKGVYMILSFSSGVNKLDRDLTQQV